MKNIKIQVLGSGCPTCKTLYNKVFEVSKKIDSELEVQYVTDVTKIIELGGMTSPVFAINKEIITAGRIPDEQSIKQAILKKLNS